MPLKTRPLNNCVLIEILREYEGVSRIDDDEVLKTGRVIAFNSECWHITASSAIVFDDDTLKCIKALSNDIEGKIVRWEQYAEGGQTFEEGGKTYALIPWWRLISVTEAE